MSTAAASMTKPETRGTPAPRRDTWREKPLRFLCHLNPTKSEVSHLPEQTEVSFVPMEAVGEYGGLDLSQSKPIESVLQGYTYFRDGDVLIAKITPCFENGKGSIASGLNGGIGFGTTELHVLRCREEINARFLFYVTLSHEFRHRGAGWMYGAGGQKRIPEEYLRNFVAPVPPLDEQEAIADWLDDRTKRIDELMRMLTGMVSRSEQHGHNTPSMVGLLTEYRQALITAAVTGKIDVRKGATA